MAKKREKSEDSEPDSYEIESEDHKEIEEDLLDKYPEVFEEPEEPLLGELEIEANATPKKNIILYFVF